MSKKFLHVVAAIAAILVLSGTGQKAAVSATESEIELILGTGETSDAVFSVGNGISNAVVLNASGVKVYNFGTKGDQDNLKRIAAKKRAINLALVTAKGLSAAKKGELKAVSGIMAVGTVKGQPLLLIVRNEAPNGVSKTAYSKAIGEIVKALKDQKSAKVLKGAWKGWQPSDGNDSFKAAGVAVHKASMM
jgi:hypothetical protein